MIDFGKIPERKLQVSKEIQNYYRVDNISYLRH